jgi:ATP synthase protein I
MKDPKQDEFTDEIGKKEEKMIKAGQRKNMGTFTWLGMMGIVGWSVAIPLLFGIFLGKWIDAHIQGRYSFTLMFMFAGLLAGCWNAWYWVQKEMNSVNFKKTRGSSAENRPTEKEEKK